MTKLHFRTIQAISAQIRPGQISPIELTNYMLDRINTCDGQLKSYATIMTDHA